MPEKLKTCPTELADAKFEKLAEAIRIAKEDRTKQIYGRVKRTAFFGAVFAVSLAGYFLTGGLQ